MVAATVKDKEALAGLPAQDQAVESIDDALASLHAQWALLCREHQTGRTTDEQFRDRRQALRAQIDRLEEQHQALVAASDVRTAHIALRELYHSAVPDAGTHELAVDITIALLDSKNDNPRVVDNGTSLHTSSEFALTVRPTHDAHIYVFRESADGDFTRLYPHNSSADTNPISGGRSVRVPAEPTTLRIKHRTDGTELLFVAASLQPISDLSLAQGRESFGPELLNCAPHETCEGDRLLTHSRGLELSADEGAPEGVSLRSVTQLGDDRLLQVIRLPHAEQLATTRPSR